MLTVIYSLCVCVCMRACVRACVCAVLTLSLATLLYFCACIICAWRHVHNQLVCTSLPSVYTSHIQNRLFKSKAAKVHLNCVSRDKNNEAHSEGACRGIGGPLTTFDFWQKCQYVLPNVLSFDFSNKWHCKKTECVPLKCIQIVNHADF